MSLGLIGLGLWLARLCIGGQARVCRSGRLLEHGKQVLELLRDRLLQQLGIVFDQQRAAGPGKEVDVVVVGHHHSSRRALSTRGAYAFNAVAEWVDASGTPQVRESRLWNPTGAMFSV